MSWLKKIFSLQSSQETKVYYEVNKDKKEEEKQQVTKSEIENLQIDDSQSSWWSLWSSLSQTFSNSPKGEKQIWGELSCDKEEEIWWDSFKSSQKSTQKSSQESSSFQRESNQMKIMINKKMLQEETKMTMAILKLNFMLNVAKIKNLNITDLFLFLVTWIM